MLSGIQHFAFCRRQWALIHIEQQWQENEYTVAGELLHKNAHDPFSMRRGRMSKSAGQCLYFQEPWESAVSAILWNSGSRMTGFPSMGIEDFISLSN